MDLESTAPHIQITGLNTQTCECLPHCRIQYPNINPLLSQEPVAQFSWVPWLIYDEPGRLVDSQNLAVLSRLGNVPSL